MYTPLILTVFFAVSLATPVPDNNGSNQLFRKTIAGNPPLGRAIRSDLRVYSPAAFASGAASTDYNNDNDGVGNGTDQYVYYSGPASSFPTNKTWVSFGDMFENYAPQMLISCGNENPPQQNDRSGPFPQEVGFIRDAILSAANSSLVDHRFILAVVMQESTGCVRVPRTTNSDGGANPGLMQSANGTSFDSKAPVPSILQMIRDGTQGTTYGNGLVQAINRYGNVYDAARIYNSGSIPADGNLSGGGATSCYVSDIANRLTGWANAPHGCPPP